MKQNPMHVVGCFSHTVCMQHVPKAALYSHEHLLYMGPHLFI